ncbi:MAG: ribonuclease HII [Ardenticatenaceae bacterium]
MGPTLNYETIFWETGHHYIAGVDEVGRGCLAGPVVAGAVILPVHDRVICNVLRAAGLRDSKKLSARQREGLVPLIEEIALAYAIGVASSAEIDQHGIVPACRLAMGRALRGLSIQPTGLLVDGPTNGSFFSLNQKLMSDPQILQPSVGNLGNNSTLSQAFDQTPQKGASLWAKSTQRNVIRGDSACLSIAAAAVIAKVHRDTLMVQSDRLYPGYAFGSHKGYGTAAHRAALRRLGATPIHRMTWKPLRELSIVQMELKMED